MLPWKKELLTLLMLSLLFVLAGCGIRHAEETEAAGATPAAVRETETEPASPTPQDAGGEAEADADLMSHSDFLAAEEDSPVTVVLVSTTVIEVGVDVSNAALMLIENAERFGLSQLHQLRGRVGRGRHQSYCVLVTDSETADAKARMKVMCETTDGFRIAEEDLRLRGPGDFFGSRQHGLPEMHVADLGTDTETLLRSKEAAERLLREDPMLAFPEHAALRERVEMMTEKMNGTLN